MPTIGAFNGIPPMEPKKGAPKANTPPSAVATQYPLPPALAAPTAETFPKGMPRSVAVPNALTPPPRWTSQ